MTASCNENSSASKKKIQCGNVELAGYVLEKHPYLDKRKLQYGNAEIARPVQEKSTANPLFDFQTYADRGVTVHCFHNRISFVPGSFKKGVSRTLVLADNSAVKSEYLGDVIIPFEGVYIKLGQKLYLHSLGYNLVSTGRLVDNGIESLFRHSDLLLK